MYEHNDVLQGVRSEHNIINTRAVNKDDASYNRVPQRRKKLSHKKTKHLFLCFLIRKYLFGVRKFSWLEIRTWNKQSHVEQQTEIVMHVFAGKRS